MHRNSLGDGYGGELVRELFSVSGGGGLQRGLFQVTETIICALASNLIYLWERVVLVTFKAMVRN